MSVIVLQTEPSIAFEGSRKRTRRMRVYRFKALSLEAARRAYVHDAVTVPRVPLVSLIDGPYVREGVATAKIDRLQLERERRLRRIGVMVVAVAMLLAWLLL